MKRADRILAIIPAREGSKRLLNKNILPLSGKPLIQWTVDAAVESGQFQTIMISTDSEKIAGVVKKKNNVEIPYLRKEELATDSATSVDVILDVISYYESIGYDFDMVALLQPTSPLRTSENITECIDLFYQKSADSIVSVTECEHSPLWCNSLPNNLSLSDFLSTKLISTRSQDLPKYYRLNGAIYIAKTKLLKQSKTFFLGESTFAYIMDKEESVDIDNEFDFNFAKFILESRINF